MDILEKNRIKNSLFRIGKGVLISIITTLVLIFIFSILLTFTDIPESTINPVIIFISVISILLGSSICTLKIKSKGLVNGGTVGIVYVLILYILSAILYKEFSLNLESVIMIVGAIISGMIGGIIGVNL